MANPGLKLIYAICILTSEVIFAHDAPRPLCELVIQGQEQAISGFSRLESLTENLSRLENTMSASFKAEFDLDQKLFAPAKLLMGQVALAFAQWDPVDHTSNARLTHDLPLFERKATRFVGELNLWYQRMITRDFNEIRDDPRLLLPNRIYRVQTERGDTVAVRFSHKVLEEFFWEDKHQVITNAAQHAVEAVARGYQPISSRGASGIATLPAAIGGRTVYKIMIVGNGIGAHRIYGLVTNGVIGFVTHEESSDHDAAFLQRVTRRAIRAYESLGW